MLKKEKKQLSEKKVSEKEIKAKEIEAKMPQPLAKTKRQGLFANRKIMLVVGILLTALAIIGAGIFAFYLYQQDLAEKEAAALDALPRIVVPEGHFAEKEYSFTFINGMKAVKLTPKTDLYADINATEDAVAAEVDKIIADMQTLGMNAIVIDTKYDQSVVFQSKELKTTSVDLLKLITEKAKAAQMNVIPVFHMTGISTQDEILINEHLNYEHKQVIYDAAAELARSYEIDSILLDDYYAQKDGKAYTEYVSYGAIGSFDDWIIDNTITVVRETAKAVHQANSAIPAGLLIRDVWANEEQQAGGSKTQAEYSALLNGFADTKSMIANGEIDFINVEIVSLIESQALPFQTLAAWWGDLCKSVNMPFYITHSVANANADGAGTDQLAKQVSMSVKTPAYQGSIFSGLSTLMDHLDDSTDILLKYYQNEYEDEDLLQGLEMSSPKQKSFTTYEETIQFRGKYDPNQEVILNGAKVEPSSRGGFSVWVPLKVGKNTITLEHKGKKTSYTIERKVIIFKEVSPTGNMKVAGGSEIEFNVIAYKDSTITATINGTTVTLQQGGGGEGITAESAYVTYQGSFTVPKATNKEQNIGSITFNGNYQGHGASAKGATITIDKMPDEVDPDEATGQILQHAVVSQRYAETYPYLTTPGYPQGILYQLPEGTQDIVQSVSGNFVNLRSGKTVRANTVSLEDIAFEGNNAITQFTLGAEGNSTVLRATFNWKAPFSLTPSPYPSAPSGTSNGYAFGADTITLLFDYTTIVDKEKFASDLSGSAIFSGMTHERVKNEERGIWQYKVTLNLAQAGRYYGCHSYYDGNTLVMKFNHPPSGGSLNGITIAVDAGHGGKDFGNMAGRDIIEKEATMMQAEALKIELEALGADVIMTRTDDSTLSVEGRADIAQAYQVDLFISCHYNSAGSNQNPNGVQTYFNTPFSQPLGSYVQSRLAAVMGDSQWNKVHNSIPDYNFVVNRAKQYPSILIEYGFLSNPYDEQRAMDPSHIQAMAQATAQGVLDYYSAYN